MTSFRGFNCKFIHPESMPTFLLAEYLQRAVLAITLLGRITAVPELNAGQDSLDDQPHAAS